MSATKLFGSWGTYRDFAESWSDYDWQADTRPVVDGIATEEELLFASYGGAAYEGDALVLFLRGGTLYEVHGGHCSCYGLEGQWLPEETTWEAVAARPWDAPHTDDENPLHDHDTEALEAMRALLASHTFRERTAPEQPTGETPTNRKGGNPA